jgi:IclR family mhp operon transcriptional activator
VARSLDVLAALNRRPFSGLRELKAETGMAKPTLHRLLEVLRAEGYVVRDEVRSLYRLTAKVRDLSSGFGEDCLVTDLGAGILRRVTAEIAWPLAIGTLQGIEMVVRYSTMPYSPLAARPTTTANRHGLLSSAMGRAYLAFCEPSERAFLVEAVRRSASPEAGLAADPASVDEILRETAARGYGLRLPGPRSDTGSIAVPIFADRHLAGVLSLTVFGGMIEQCRERFPAVLQATASEISAKLREATRTPALLS